MRQALLSTLYDKRAFRATLPGVFLASIFGLFAFVSSVVRGEEEREAFLEALKARGYDDVALVYLKNLQDSGQETPELDEEIDYKIGEAATSAYATSSGARRETLASQARDAFEKYLEASPDGKSAPEANSALARLDLDKGDRLLADAQKKGVPAETRVAGLLAARLAFSEAKKRLDAALPKVQARAKELQNDPASNPQELQRVQALFLDLLIRVATQQAQTARTFPQDSAEYKDGLKSAVDKYAKIASTYSRYVGSFTARFLEAQARRELGDDDGALASLSELGVLPYEDQFFGLKTRALALYAQIVDQRDAPESNMELVRKFNVWENESSLPKEYRESYEGLQIRLLSSRALVRLEKLRRTDYAAFGTAGKKTFTDSDDPAYKIMNVPKSKKSDSVNSIIVLALKTLGSLASGKGTEALEAQNLLKDEIFANVDLSKYSFSAKVDSFESALNAATRDAASFSQARQDLANAAPEALAEAKRAVEDSASIAIRSFRTAFEYGGRALKPDKKGALDAQKKKETLVALDKLYLQYAALCYAAERYEDALAVGDYLARSRPDFEDASQGALVGLRSLQQILASTRDKNGETRETIALQARLDEYASFIVERWGEDETNAAVAQEASTIQLEAAVVAGDVDSARAFLQKIPESSSRRSVAELRLGQALWNERQKLVQELDSNESDGGTEEENAARQETKKKLDEITDGARQALYDGIERKLTSSAGVAENDYLAIYSTYLLAQVYETQNDLENAEKWLTHPVIGALSAVERALKASEENAENDKLIDDNFQLATLALVLRLLIAKPDRFDEAEKIMAQLEEIVKRSPENADKLTGVYLRLGKSLEERLRELKDASDQGDETKKEELATTTQGFETFLKRAAAREDGNGYGSLRWIADSFLSLGRGISGSLNAPPKEALDYFAEAGKTYQTILRKLDADPNFAPSPNARLAVQLKIVECLRSAGAFSKAFEQLKKLILDPSSANNIDVQLEAARTFQDWGRLDSQYYVKAIVGGANKGGTNLVWGWNGIIKRLAPSVDKGERRRELFYEACLSKTRCRYLYVVKIKDKAERDKQIRDAENDLKRLAQTRPDLGGVANFKKFDSAYKNFQKLRGEKQIVGLRASSASQNDSSK